MLSAFLPTFPSPSLSLSFSFFFFLLRQRWFAQRLFYPISSHLYVWLNSNIFQSPFFFLIFRSLSRALRPIWSTDRPVERKEERGRRSERGRPTAALLYWATTTTTTTIYLSIDRSIDREVSCCCVSNICALSFFFLKIFFCMSFWRDKRIWNEDRAW